MAHNYIVTAKRSSAVSKCLKGNLVRPDELNLVTAKLSRLEISKITQDGLRLMQEVGIYGRIEALQLFRPPGSNKDLIFLLTQKHHVAILECLEGPQPDTLEIVTRRSGNIADLASRPAETGSIVIVDPQCKMIGLRLYDGLFKVIPLDKNKSNDFTEAFNVRMEEITVPDITFLHGFNNPTIGFIHKDNDGASHVKTYEISLKEKEFTPGPWFKSNVANEASIIIPVPQPFGGAIIVSLESIVYVNGDEQHVTAPTILKESPIIRYTQIDGNGDKYLLGDCSGRLFCLILEASDYRPSETNIQIKKIRLELLGEISTPECLTYLDNSIVYVGSKLGDSQLIRILKEPDGDSSFIQVCETYCNLGPIVDMCLVDLEKQGQGQLVTCSGYRKDGSLRIVRNGIGINEHGSMDVSGINGVWSLRIYNQSGNDNHLFVTFNHNVSNLWACEPDGDFSNIDDDDGFDRTKRTVLCTNVANDQIVQVTRDSVRLINALNKQLVATWNLPSNTQYPDGHGIDKVTNTQDYVVCADGATLYVLKIGPQTLELAETKTLEAQIACLHMTQVANGEMLLSLGFWIDRNIVIYSFPSFQELYREELSSDTIPRSIIIAKFEDNYYLLCALGDGLVYYFNLDPSSGRFYNCKKVTLGTYETVLKTFKSKSTMSIFACSDRPTVIYSSNNKLVFSNVNLKEVECMCSLNTECFPDSLALVSKTGILVGTIDEIQKLHIRTIPLNESPIRVAHQSSTQTFGLLTMRRDIQDLNGPQPMRPSASTQARSKTFGASMPPKPAAIPDQSEVDISSFLVVDQHTFEVLHAHQFMSTEQVISILSTRLGETNEEYFVIGTAFVFPDEPEPKQGRLVVFKWTHDSKIQQVAELSIKGCPYCLCEYDGKFLVGVNASVNLVELNSRRDLHIECTYVNATMALLLKRKGHLILMGDLMRSMSLFSYKQLQSHFEEIARDFNPAWVTEVEILDEETFLGAEHQYNLFVCQRDSKANDQDRQQMQHVGAFYLGDSVNIFRQGSIVVQHPSETSIDIKQTTLFGTVDGVIGLVLTIDQALFERLDAIQNSLGRTLKSVGRIDHKEWRAFYSNKCSQPACGFIDGDLVEAFLDLSRDAMEVVAKDVNESVEDLVKMIEELSRLH